MTARAGTSFTQVVHGGAVVLEAHGALDVLSVPLFRAAMADAVAVDRPLVVVDLDDVAFLDSAGLAVVFGAQRELPPTKRMMLANVPARMSRTLRLAGVDAILDVHTPGQPQPWLNRTDP